MPTPPWERTYAPPAPGSTVGNPADGHWQYSTGPDGAPQRTWVPNKHTTPSGNAIPSGTANPGSPGKPPVVSGTGIGLLAISGLGAIALANTAVGPVVIAALVAAVIWNGQQLVTVVAGKAPATGTGITG